MRTHATQLYDLSLQKKIQDAMISPNGLLPFYHPAYEAILFEPFTVLPYPQAYLAFISLNFFLLLAIFLVGKSIFWQVSAPCRWSPELMFFLFIPLLTDIACGQDSILSLLLYLLSWKQLKAGRGFSAGLLVALGMFKLQLAIPIAALIAIRAGRRFVYGFLLGLAGVTLLCTGLVGVAGMSALAHLIFGAASTIGKGTQADTKMGIFPLATPNIAGLFYACGGRWLSSPILFNAITGICSLGVFIWCARVIRRCVLEVAFSIAILCGLLVSYHLFMYDLTLLLIPIALLADRIPKYVLVAAYVLPLLPFMWTTDFLLAIPVLSMLVYATRSAPEIDSPRPIPQLAGV